MHAGNRARAAGMTGLLCAVVALAGCGGGGARPADANIGGGGPPDAASCPVIDFQPGKTISAGARFDLYGLGHGAWAAEGQAMGPPGDMLYIEAYRNTFKGDLYSQIGFHNWVLGCQVCVFVARGCKSYQVQQTGAGNPIAPTNCDSLYMMDHGSVSFDRFDTDPNGGRLEGTVKPLSGDDTVDFLQVGQSGNPWLPGGFGQLLPNSTCFQVSSIRFSSAWGDAATPDGGIGGDAGGDAGGGAIDAGSLDAHM